MGLNPSDLPHYLLIYPSLDQGYVGKQGQHHRCGWRSGQAFVAWELLRMRAQIETDLSLDDAVDQ
jgi:hypothetical protein